MPAGQFGYSDGRVLVGTGSDALELLAVQPAGKDADARGGLVARARRSRTATRDQTGHVSETRTRIQPARRVAYEVISAVRRIRRLRESAAAGAIERAELSGPDAALATELTYGTLRMLGYYDSGHRDRRATGRPGRSTPRSSMC